MSFSWNIIVVEPFLMGAVVLYFFTRTLFKCPPAKSSEQPLGEALIQYLGTEVKVRIEIDD